MSHPELRILPGRIANGSEYGAARFEFEVVCGWRYIYAIASCSDISKQEANAYVIPSTRMISASLIHNICRYRTKKTRKTARSLQV